MDEDRQKEFWATLALRYCPGLGARSQKKLLLKFGGAYNAFMERKQWQNMGISERAVSGMRREVWRIPARKEWQNAHKLNLPCVLWSDADYPAILRNLPDAPAILYYKGDISLFRSPAIALVGSRKASPYGLDVAAHMARALASSGMAVVSGMAQGIDARAHKSALPCVGGTIGVLGTGIDRVYPASNRALFGQMQKNGLLVSEFPPGTPPCAANFPIRNRIISGLSLGVVVIEAAKKSGSLITAKCAVEQNREVFAIPGAAFDKQSGGCQDLVRQGAHVVFNAEDILRDLAPLLQSYHLEHVPETEFVRDTGGQEKNGGDPANVEDGRMRPLTDSRVPDSRKLKPVDNEVIEELLTDNSQRLVKLLQTDGSMQVDEIAENLQIELEELNSIILGLEMLGAIKRLPGARFAIDRL